MTQYIPFDSPNGNNKSLTPELFTEGQEIFVKATGTYTGSNPVTNSPRTEQSPTKVLQAGVFPPTGSWNYTPDPATGTPTETVDMEVDWANTDPSNPATSFSYTWETSSDGGTTWTSIGTNSNIYTPVTGDVGNLIRVTSTASNAAGDTTTPVTQAWTNVVVVGGKQTKWTATIVTNGFWDWNNTLGGGAQNTCPAVNGTHIIAGPYSNRFGSQRTTGTFRTSSSGWIEILYDVDPASLWPTSQIAYNEMVALGSAQGGTGMEVEVQLIDSTGTLFGTYTWDSGDANFDILNSSYGSGTLLRLRLGGPANSGATNFWKNDFLLDIQSDPSLYQNGSVVLNYKW